MERRIRIRFNEAWEAIVSSKRRNKMNLSHQEYQFWLKLIRYLKTAPVKALNNNKLLRKYDIAIEGGLERLVKPSPQEGVTPDQCLLYVTNEEIFDVLNEAYIDTNHGGRHKIYNRIHGRYYNVTMEAVDTYLKVRQQIELNEISTGVAQGLLPVPPSVQSHVNGITSVYFGFVDMHRYACDGYRCIMVHLDTNTWFTHMVPLQSMGHVHVAVGLLAIYSKVGIPNFIDAPHDRPYITSIIDHMKKLWRGGDCCITIRSSDDQNAIKTGWNMVQGIMAPWMNSTSFQCNWPSKLKYIQHITNKRIFSGLTMPPLIYPSV